MDNPVKYTDPIGHSVSDCGNSSDWECNDWTATDAAQNAKNLADLTQASYKEKCKTGNDAFCSTFEKHPAEVIGFTVSGLLIAGVAPELDLTGGATVNTITSTASTLYQTAYATLITALTNWATKNPDSPLVSLGSWLKADGYTNVGDTFGYTYFQLPFYNLLDKISNITEDVNGQFIANQVEQAKTFLVTFNDLEAGDDTLVEMGANHVE